MPDKDRLKDKLTKLTESEAAGPDGRLLVPRENGLLGAILDEIDETILARRLTFRNDDGEEVVLDVAGRRLVRIFGLPADDPDTQGLVGEDAGAQLAGLKRALDGFLASTEGLAVRTEALEDRPDASAVGRSAEALAAALQVTTTSPEERAEPTLEAVIERLGDVAFAIQDGADVVASGGDLGILSTVGPEAVDALFAKAALGDGPASVVLADSAGSAILVGRSGTLTLLASSPDGDAVRLAAAWNAVFS